MRFHKFLVYCFIFLFSHVYAFQYNLSICTIFNNEAPYIKEWIDYHLKAGVDHFWLYNNNSTDDFLPVLAPYIQKKIVTLIQWPSVYQGSHHFFYQVQCKAYDHCLKITKGRTKWLAIIDSDEFIVPKKYGNIKIVLETHFKNCSGVGINWQMFGTSGVEKCPLGKTLHYLIKKSKVDHPCSNTMKCIVQPLQTINCPCPHFCNYKPGLFAVNTHHERIPDGVAHTNVYIDFLQINHYWTRDEWYMHNIKIPRRNLWEGKDNSAFVLDMASQMNEEIDTSILEILNN